MSVAKDSLQVASAVTLDTKTIPETIKIIESLLAQYPISGKPMSNTIFYRDGSGINFEVFAYTLPSLTEDFLARDNVEYFLAKKGEIHNRRTSFIFPQAADGLAYAFVVDFCISANTAKHLTELKKELDSNQKEKAEYSLEVILKNKALLTRFGQLYDKIQIFFLGNGTVPSKALAFAMNLAYPNIPINTLKITQIKISCLSNLNYNQSLVSMIVSLLKWGNANARLFLDTLNDLKTLKKLNMNSEAQAKANQEKMIAEQAKEEELQTVKTKLLALQQSITKIEHEIKQKSEEVKPFDQLIKSFSESLTHFQSHSEDALSWKIFNLTLLLIKYKFIMDSRKNEHNASKSLTGVARLKFILEVDPKIKAGFFRVDAESVKIYLGNLSPAFMNSFLSKKENPKLLCEELQALQRIEVERIKSWETKLNEAIYTAEGNWLKRSVNFMYTHSLASSIGGIFKNFPRASIAMGAGAATFSGGSSIFYSLGSAAITYIGTSLLSNITSTALKHINPERQLNNTKELIKTTIKQGLKKITDSDLYLQISQNTLDELLTIDNATLTAKALGIGIVSYYTSHFTLARSLATSILGAHFFSYMSTPVLNDNEGLIVVEGNTKINRAFCSYSIAGLIAFIESAYYYKINPIAAFLGGVAGSESLTKLAPMLSSKLRTAPGAALTGMQQLAIFLFNVLGYELGRYWIENVLNRQETQTYWFKYLSALEAQGKLSQVTHKFLGLDSRNSEHHALTELEGSSLKNLFFSANNLMNIGWKTTDNRFYQVECKIVGEITQYPILPTMVCNGVNLLKPRLNYV